MTVKERLIQFLKAKKISQKKFAQAVGLSYGYVNAIRVSIQPDTLHKIAMQFPELNTGWLMTGEGQMLKTNDSDTLPPITEEELVKIGAIAFEKKLLELFQSGQIYPGKVVEEKEKLINELYREIGRLEAKINVLESQKANAQGEDSVISVDVKKQSLTG